jgi:hypothetical protein
MYATGIGLVIIGLQRFEKEMLKTEKPAEKKKKAPRLSFFDGIKKFFEEDGEN